MSKPNLKPAPPSVRILPEEVANKIAAGEVVERPGSVVKELLENALDASATQIVVRLVAAGRRLIEVIDNGHGMGQQDAVLAIERSATSKIRRIEDLDNVVTMGFRGEALASIAAVSRFELITRREQDDSGTRVRVDGGVLRDVSQTAAASGTRISVNRLYFNTPVRAKFLKGMTTELSQSVDLVQRHALAHTGVGFQLFHNEKVLLDIPEKASLRERVALIWGLGFLREMLELEDEQNGIRFHGLLGTPSLTRAQRSHQFFFVNGRPIVNRSLQYGFEDGYRELLTVGRRPVGVVLLEAHPRLVDVNIHPTKREVRFRDERAMRDATRAVVRGALEAIAPGLRDSDADREPLDAPAPRREWQAPQSETHYRSPAETTPAPSVPTNVAPPPREVFTPESPVQTEFARPSDSIDRVEPAPVYAPVAGLHEAPLQVFDAYLLVPEHGRLLIIDQHALHERLTYDSLCTDLVEQEYESQQLVVPLVIDVPPSHVRLLETNLALFDKLGLSVEPFGGNTFQVTAICHLYDESKVSDAVYRVLDRLAQGDLFDRTDFMADLLRLTVEACRGSVKAGDRLTPAERRALLEGFRRLRPPYTCPHGRPIIIELTQVQMEKSFRRRQ